MESVLGGDGFSEADRILHLGVLNSLTDSEISNLVAGGDSYFYDMLDSLRRGPGAVVPGEVVDLTDNYVSPSSFDGEGVRGVSSDAPTPVVNPTPVVARRRRRSVARCEKCKLLESAVIKLEQELLVCKRFTRRRPSQRSYVQRYSASRMPSAPSIAIQTNAQTSGSRQGTATRYPRQRYRSSTSYRRY